MPRRLAIDFPKLSALILVGSIFLNEFLAYWLCSLSWPSFTVPEDGAVILFLADPQIQGLANEPGGMRGMVQRWDSDRFLHKGYSWAQAKYNVSAAVFLGDLVDEGSETRDQATYQDYVARFHSIYPQHSPSQQTIFIPGDNDIGGEGVDPVTLEKIQRFTRHFGPFQPVYKVGGNVEIVPVSRLTEQGHFNLSLKTAQISVGAVVVAVSHVPVLPPNGRYSERVLELVRPSVVFSAHDHRGYLFTADKETRKPVKELEKFSRSSDPSPFTLQTKDGTKPSRRVWEVVVPTCSYRMGVPEMAFGLAVVDSSGSLTYSNLWLPSRFFQLKVYLACLCLVLLLAVVRKGLSLRRVCVSRAEMQAIYRARYQPLLGGRSQD